jgi:hypothetical protein
VFVHNYLAKYVALEKFIRSRVVVITGGAIAAASLSILLQLRFGLCLFFIYFCLLGRVHHSCLNLR